MAILNESDAIDKRGRGRPRVAQSSLRVSTWVPTPLADRLIQLAQKHDVSVSQIVRTMVVLQLRDKP
jgi:hypothetical protein